MAKRVPIHTISFNCSDSEANQFLYDLAQTTDGRYHIFADRGNPVGQSEVWQVGHLVLVVSVMEMMMVMGRAGNNSALDVDDGDNGVGEDDYSDHVEGFVMLPLMMMMMMMTVVMVTEVRII